MFFICIWKNGWANNQRAGDSKRHRAHYDVTVVKYSHCLQYLRNRDLAKSCILLYQSSFVPQPLIFSLVLVPLFVARCISYVHFIIVSGLYSLRRLPHDTVNNHSALIFIYGNTVEGEFMNYVAPLMELPTLPRYFVLNFRKQERTCIPQEKILTLYLTGWA